MSDTSGQKVTVDERLRELHRRVEKLPELDDRDRQALIELIEFWRGWRWFLKGAKILLVSLAALAAGVSAWDRMVDWMQVWLRAR